MAIATTTIIVLVAVLAVAAAGVSAYASYQQGQSQKRMAEYNAKIRDSQAKSLEQSSTASQQQAAYEAQQTRERKTRLLATQRVSYLKSGVEISGSALDVMNDTATELEMDALTSIYKGQISGGQYSYGADVERAGGAMSRMGGKTAAEQGNYAAVGSLLSGAGSAVGYAGAYQSARTHNNSPTIS